MSPTVAPEIRNVYLLRYASSRRPDNCPCILRPFEDGETFYFAGLFEAVRWCG